MAKQDKCTIGYSCGQACINTSYECRDDGIIGDFATLSKAFLSHKKAQPLDVTQLKREDSIGSGAFGRAWIVGDKLIKRYHEQDAQQFEQFKKSAELANNTLGSAGVMPKILSMYQGKDGKYYSEQEALIGYVSGDTLKAERKTLDRASLEAAVDKIRSALAEAKVIHGDLHLGNLMLRLGQDGKTVEDAKLIDADFVSPASRYKQPELALAMEQSALSEDDILTYLLE